MPRTRSQKSGVGKTTVKATKHVQEESASVANVNMKQNGGKHKTDMSESSKNTGKAIKLSSSSMKKNQKSKVPKAVSEESERMQSQHVTVTFEEDDRIFKMDAQAGDESYGQSDTDDQEISFRNSQTTESGTGTECEDQSSSSDEELELPSNESGNDGSSSNDEQGEDSRSNSDEGDAQRKIDDIELQVQHKLQELEQLMTTSGLAKSAALIRDNMIASTSRRKSTGSNLNCNASNLVKPRSRSAAHLLNSNSEETVYQRAVPKHVSNSSEDVDFNSSDEQLETEFNHLQMYQGPVVEMGETSHPHGSGAKRKSGEHLMPPPPVELTPEEKANKKVWEAEAAKAQMFPVTG